jgi:hypothetical protein
MAALTRAHGLTADEVKSFLADVSSGLDDRNINACIPT